MIREQDKTKELLFMNELVELRQRIAELEVMSTGRQRVARSEVVDAGRQPLEGEMRQARNFNGDIVQSVTEGIVVEDAEGYLIFVNPAAAALLGYSPEELLGQHWTAIVPPDQHPSVQAASERRLHGKADRYELQLVRQDGTLISVLVSGSPRIENGRFAGTLAVFTDITEHKQAEAALKEYSQRLENMLEERTVELKQTNEKLQQEIAKRQCAEEEVRRLKTFDRGIVQSLTEGVVVEDAQGRLTLVNPAAAALLGYSPEELLGQHWTTIVPSDQHPSVQAAGKRHMLGEADRYELQLVRKDGTLVPVLFSGSPRVEDGRFAGTLAVFTDITERKRAEEELQQSLERLRRTFDETVNALASAVKTRDPYAAGHQRRVTQLACAIAKEMSLPEEQIEGLRVAGLIHDIGKINVPFEILSNPDELTEFEYGMIKAHPQIGYDILKAVEFPWPVAEIVLQHHERMDGSGYPQELSGEEIMLEARILGVADVVDAMAAHQPYRSALGIYKALEEISQNRGVLYDPGVVGACLKLFKQKGFKFEQEAGERDRFGWPIDDVGYSS
jgi:PAS domain S-box-containing protein/putative nucleotidyltransferase with HDIG domain